MERDHADIFEADAPGAEGPEERHEDATGPVPGGYDPFDTDMLFESRGSDRTVHWSVSWSDLMMTMFILFVVMYVYQVGNRDLVLGEGPGKSRVSEVGAGNVMESEKGKFQMPELPEETDSVVYELDRNALDASFLEEVAAVDLVEAEAMKIVLTGDLMFRAGSAEIRPGARKALFRLGTVLRRSQHMINVVGHTDSVPYHSETIPTNWELSAIRACRVARFLIEEMGIPEYRFVVTGHAHHKPVKPNTTAKNRAANRRVEIILTRERP